MPATDLKALREYVANVLDYDPTNPTYQTQVDRLLNEADRRICTEKLYTFAQVVADVEVYADKAVTDVVIGAGGSITGPASTFENWMAGHIIKFGDTEYQIAWVDSDTQAYLTTEPATAAAQDATILQRFVFVPQDCVQIVSLARRSNALTPLNPGQLCPITQYEDEWNNLPLGETGIPELWVPANPVGVRAPRIGVTTGTAAAIGLGDRTIEVGVVHQFATYMSAVADIQKVTLAPSQALTVTPVSALGNTTGLYRRVYLRAPLHGLEDWRPALNNASGKEVNLRPSHTASVTVQSSLAHLQSETYYIQPRLVSPTGTCDRIRLYPRQSESMTLQLRYLADHRPMVEDNDTSIIPAAHRMVIAYRALYEVLVKHNNPTLAELYRKRYDAGLLQLERRYLSQPSRRLVKGFMSASRMPDGPYRRRKLVRL
jgi:hypothetical protein